MKATGLNSDEPDRKYMYGWSLIQCGTLKDGSQRSTMQHSSQKYVMNPEDSPWLSVRLIHGQTSCSSEDPSHETRKVVLLLLTRM